MCYCRKAGPVRHRRQVCGLADPKRYVVTGGFSGGSVPHGGLCFSVKPRKRVSSEIAPETKVPKNFRAVTTCVSGIFAPAGPGGDSTVPCRNHGPHNLTVCGKSREACANSQTFGILMRSAICQRYSRPDRSAQTPHSVRRLRCPESVCYTLASTRRSAL